jgi:hypothetical protein
MDAGLTYSRRGGTVHLPLGLSIGFTLPAGPRLRLYPYARPHVTFVPSIIGEGHAASAVELGAGAATGPLVAHLNFITATGWPYSIYSGPDIRVGLQLGVRF